MKRMFISIFTSAIIAAAVLAGTTARAQADLTLVIADRFDNRDTLRWGISPAATNGLDRDLGEEEFPPPPPSFIFDARWAGNSGELGQGAMVNFRRLETRTQSDTFNVRIQTNLDNYPVVLTWPRLDGIFGRAMLRIVDNDGRVTKVDMRKKRSFAYTNEGMISTIVITTEIQHQ